MKFHGGMSANQIKPSRSTATHSLDGVSWWHVSNSNQALQKHSNSQSEWGFMVACQQFKSSPPEAQQLTAWMGFHGGMSAIQLKPTRSTATHILGFHGEMSAIQIKPTRSTATHILGFHGGMSAIQIKPSRSTATHFLDGVSWWHVSNSNQAHQKHSNSLPGWDFMVSCQQFRSSPPEAQQLTAWMGFHGVMSAIQIKPTRSTATHILDGVSWWNVSNSNQAHQKHSNSHPGWDFMVACCHFEILNVTCLLPHIHYVQNLPSYHLEILTSFPL